MANGTSNLENHVSAAADIAQTTTGTATDLIAGASTNMAHTAVVATEPASGDQQAVSSWHRMKMPGMIIVVAVFIVAFATNLARNFDGAFVRRIPIHIEIPLPDEDGRRRILETILPAKVPFKDRIDFAMLAAKTPGLSGGDLKNVVVNAVSDLAAQPWQTMDATALTAAFVAQAEATARAKRDVGRNPIVTEEEVQLDCPK